MQVIRMPKTQRNSEVALPFQTGNVLMCKSLVYITDMKVLTPLFPNGFVAFVIFYFLYFGRK